MIRLAQVQDYENIDKLQAASVRNLCEKHYESDFIEAWVGKPRVELIGKRVASGTSYYVFDESGQIAGFTVVNWQQAMLDGLFVDPEQAGKSIGRKLIQFVFGQAKERGIQTLYLDSSLNAYEFYRRMGFEEYERGIFKLADGLESESIKMKIKL